MNCEHKLAWGVLSLYCEKEAHPGNPEHKGTYIQTEIVWFDGDRRDYVGDLKRCSSPHCILPGGHHGNHET